MTVFLIDLEAVETRYTGEWKRHVPNLLRKAGHNVQIISGPEDIPSATTPVLFLILAAPKSISLDKWNKWGVYFAPDQFSLAIISSSLMLGILESLI